VSEQESRPRPTTPAALPAADRPLMVADVLPFAKKDCTRCRGIGFLIQIFHAGSKGEQREPRACSCSVKRFQKKHGDDIVLVNGAPHWKPGKAPKLPTA
jgi:hypothetical protein